MKPYPLKPHNHLSAVVQQKEHVTWHGMVVQQEEHVTWYGVTWHVGCWLSGPRMDRGRHVGDDSLAVLPLPCG